ncbi:MAG: DUF4845 domain-containing protein [Gammaproteobacteria bacterium]
MNRNKQRGMTAIGWLIVLALVAFFALLAIRLTPMYMEAFEVKSGLESLKNEPFITQKSKSEIFKLMRRRFDVDNVDDVDLAKSLTVDKSDGRLRIALNYELRRHVVGNLDVIGTFNPKVEIVAR